MNEAVLVRDLAELKKAREVFGGSLEKLRIYTLLPINYLHLTQEGLLVNIFSQHITAGEAHQIYDQAFHDITQIVNTFPLTEGSVSVNLARYFKVFYWEHLANVYAFDLALKRSLEGADVLYYFQSPYFPLTSFTELANVDFISSQMLNSLYKQRFPRVRLLNGGFNFKLLQRQVFNNVVRLLRGAAKNVFFSDKALVDSPVGSDYVEARVIAFGSGYDALIVIPDAIQLSSERGKRLLWMTEGIDKNSIRSGLIYSDEYDKVERFSVNDYLKRHPMPRLTLKEIQQTDRLFKKLLELLNNIEVIRRYGLVKSMGGLRQVLRMSLWHTKVMDKVLSHFAKSTIVLTDYNGIRERAIEQLAPRYQIEVIARPHGWMSNIEGFDYRANRYLVSGELSRKLVETFYGKETPVFLSADPNLRNAAREWSEKTQDERKTIQHQRRKDLSITAPFVVLFMTTGARLHILNDFDFIALVELWEHIFDYLKNHLDIHVIIKSHKNNFDWWVESQAKMQKVSNLNILKGRLEDVLVSADLAVDLGKPGTATLVALLFRKPLLLYQGLYKYIRQLGELTYATGASFVVDRPEKLVLELEKLRTEGTTYLVNLEVQNRVLLEKLVSSEELIQ
jgi:hypothetical protein